MRDAFNLAWKLALVVNRCGEALLDSYQQERRDHAKAMIDRRSPPATCWRRLSAGRGRARRSLLAAELPAAGEAPLPRNALWADAAVPRGGAADRRRRQNSPVGKMFIQPQVTLESGESVLLDEVIGANFAIIGWGCNPQWGLDAGQIARWRAIGARFIQWCRRCRSIASRDNAPGTLRVGDTQNRLKSWFAQHNTAMPWSDRTVCRRSPSRRPSAHS